MNARLALRAVADPARAPSLQRFFKTGPGGYAEGDVFIGATVPQVRKLVRLYSDMPFGEIRALLRSTIHEERLLALLILVRRYQKGEARDRDTVYRLYCGNMKWINNWDLIDVTAEHIIGAHLADRDRAPLYAWAQSDLLWPRRIAIMSTFHFIKRGDYADTLRLAGMLSRDEHDLIHKAVGWMLREIGNRDRAVEEAFLNRHAARMPRTMLRYAIEKFAEGDRKRYLAARA